MKHFKEWLAVGVAVLGFLGYLIRPSIQYGIDKTKFVTLESKVEASQSKLDLVDKHEVIIPRVEKQLNEISVRQEAFLDKYDRNREDDQRFFRTLMTEVRKNNG